nr:InlB B-repeat-containing protein [Bifidobacterium vespertilionis]
MTGYSYDKDGKNAVADGFAVKGDTKVYAQYATAKKVTFDANNNGKADAGETIDVKSGSAVDAKTYGASGLEAIAAENAPAGEVFAGWKQSKAEDVNDLYTDQAITDNTTLYPVYEKYSSIEDDQNVSVVDFHQNGTANTATVYTLANKPFPAFRAPSTIAADEYQAPLGTKYDFTKAVANDVQDFGKADLTIYGVSFAEAKGWKVTYDFEGADATYNKVGALGGDQASAFYAEGTKATQPSDPAKKGYQFTGWYTTDGKTKIDFSKNVEDLPGAEASTRTVEVRAGWTNTNVVPVVFYYGYHEAKYQYPTLADTDKVAAGTGKALDYVVSGSAITTPTGLEDYYQTAADKAHDTYTSTKVTGWYAVADDAPVSTITAGTEVYAKWTSSFAVKLNGNGGFFKNGTNYLYVTVADGEKLQDKVETPTRDGYNFLFWANGTDKSQYANLYDGYWYNWDGTKLETIQNTNELVAVWVPTANDSAVTLHDRFNLSGVSKSDDVQKLVDAGYTEASAKAYVDAWYALQNEYWAAIAKDGQAQIDAFNALVPKYQAAEALLVKSDVPVQPEVEKVAVYRLYNPGLAQVAQHLYTTNVDEYNRLQQSEGWKGEGIVFYTTSDKTAAPVYRLYNQYTSEHFLTSDKAEYEDLYQNKGWTNEGVAWYIPSDGTADLYRLQNPVSFEHLYTTNAAEKDNLTANAGWVLEGAPYKVYAK